MSAPPREFAFTGSAFLCSDAARLLELARELDDRGVIEALEAAPLAIEPEYNRLFLNPAGSPCALWQSAHTGERRLMGEPHLSALDWYRRYHVEPAVASDPADHIGLLLLFFARLLETEASDHERAAFAAEHLAWIPRFCESVSANTQHPFFALLADRAKKLVEEGGNQAADSRQPQRAATETK